MPIGVDTRFFLDPQDLPDCSPEFLACIERATDTLLALLNEFSGRSAGLTANKVGTVLHEEIKITVAPMLARLKKVASLNLTRREAEKNALAIEAYMDSGHQTHLELIRYCPPPIWHNVEATHVTETSSRSQQNASSNRRTAYGSGDSPLPEGPIAAK